VVVVALHRFNDLADAPRGIPSICMVDQVSFGTSNRTVSMLPESMAH